MKVALYMRVSTDSQTTDSQRPDLEAYCAARKWDIAHVFEDVISGASSSRNGLDQMLAEVRRGRFKAIVCWKLDRLGRSLPHLAQMISEFDGVGCALVCPGQGIDTSVSNPAGRLQMHILMAIAEFERELIRERTRAGLSAARARGVKMGRPRMDLPADWKPRCVGKSVRWIVRELGVSMGKATQMRREANTG